MLLGKYRKLIQREIDITIAWVQQQNLVQLCKHVVYRSTQCLPIIYSQDVE